MLVRMAWWRKKLSADENEIHLTIADDGVGLPDNSQDTSKGMGLLNMGAK